MNSSQDNPMNFISSLLNEVYGEDRFSEVGNEKERKEIEAIISKHLPAMNASLRNSGIDKVNTVGDIATIINMFVRKGRRFLDVGEVGTDEKGNVNHPQQGVNVMPVVKDLERYGLLKRIGDNKFAFNNVGNRNDPNKPVNKKVEALKQLISLKKSSQEKEYIDTGEVKPAGRLKTNLDATPDSKGYKIGQDKSSLEYAKMAESIKQRDPDWQALSDVDKQTVIQLGTLSDPLAAFKIIRKLVQLREIKARSKKNYTAYVQDIKSSFDSDPNLFDVSEQLDSMGIINQENLTLNTEKVASIRNVINFIAKNNEELNITAEQKIKAFLPNFSKFVKQDIRQRGVESVKNMIVTGRMSAAGKNAMKQINSPLLSQDILDRIVNKENKTEVQQIIAQIATLFGTTDLEELRARIKNKEGLRRDFKGDDNLDALATGRQEQFKKLFSI